MRASYLHLVLLLLLLAGVFMTSACSYCSGLDEYDDYTFGGQVDAGEGETPDAGGDGGMSSADAGETWWEEFDRLSAKVSPGCAEIAPEHLYCTGGVELDVDLECPEHCHAVTGRHCFCPYVKGYEEAREICRSTGLQLVKIDDREENDILGGLMTDMGINFGDPLYGPGNVSAAVWIGLNDREQEDTFVWHDGSDAVFKNWALDQPDDLTQPDGEDCVTLQVAENDEFPWYDQPCGYYEDNESAGLLKHRHFFFCETTDADRAMGEGSTGFVDDDIAGCTEFPSTWGTADSDSDESCCTTLKEVAGGGAIEPGRCGTIIGGMCMQRCKPGKVDYLSGCPEERVNEYAIAPCCSVWGDEITGFACGVWFDGIGCSPYGPGSGATCTEPTAYKGDDEPLVDWLECDEECTLNFSEELTWAEQCCTEEEDVERFTAYETGKCGLNWAKSGGPDSCSQLGQTGEPDSDCEPFYIAGFFGQQGCCTDFGYCGAFLGGDQGCAVTTTPEERSRLCIRKNKDPEIGVDLLQHGDYGNCEDPVEHNGKTYYHCRGPLEWKQAQAACEWKQDRHLVHIDDAEENAFLNDNFGNAPFWIGASEGSAVELQAAWRWSDTGERFFNGFRYKCSSGGGDPWVVYYDSYVNWLACPDVPEDQAQPYDDLTADTMDGGVMDAGGADAGEADGGAGNEIPKEDCAQMRTDGYWSDEYCELKKAFVCEEAIP